MDDHSLIPLRRADTRDDQVIEIGFTESKQGHKFSWSRDRGITAPIWIESPGATISLLNVRTAVAKRLNKTEYKVISNDLWNTLDTELRIGGK